MRILGLETSCDETACAIVEDGRVVLSNVVSTQNDLHRRYKGVVPEIASRAHLERILPVIDEALRVAGMEYPEVDVVAVGNRPGLVGSLVVGVAAAKALAWSLGKPIIGVDHVQAHLHAGDLVEKGVVETPEPTAFPALGLIVSGGHTSVYLVESATRQALIGRTIDDAVGEAYDKAAVILGLPYPGGPNLDKLAASVEFDIKAARAGKYDLPQSLMGDGNLDFSFSGIKTALLYKVKGPPIGRGAETTFARTAEELGDDERARLAASFQYAVIETVIKKLGRSLEALRQGGVEPKCLIVGGGVSANSYLRKRAGEFAQRQRLRLIIPAMRYCMDNASMIAGLAYHQMQAGKIDDLFLPTIATTSIQEKRWALARND
jgi:N6-L-threonylcarbamoyladenine synthase